MIPAEAVEGGARKPRAWVWWLVVLMPVLPFILFGLWLVAVHEPVMFFVCLGVLAAICVGGQVYANGGTK